MATRLCRSPLNLGVTLRHDLGIAAKAILTFEGNFRQAAQMLAAKGMPGPLVSMVKSGILAGNLSGADGDALAGYRLTVDSFLAALRPKSVFLQLQTGGMKPGQPRLATATVPPRGGMEIDIDGDGAKQDGEIDPGPRHQA